MVGELRGYWLQSVPGNLGSQHVASPTSGSPTRIPAHPRYGALFYKNKSANATGESAPSIIDPNTDAAGSTVDFLGGGDRLERDLELDDSTSATGYKIYRAGRWSLDAAAANLFHQLRRLGCRHRNSNTPMKWRPSTPRVTAR
ncbi:MAG: hypothetical protein MZW92_17850 [Comamonadaceae bacterium]|nr:hypothetical protein [Comamonadaceae bacterium]